MCYVLLLLSNNEGNKIEETYNAMLHKKGTDLKGHKQEKKN